MEMVFDFPDNYVVETREQEFSIEAERFAPEMQSKIFGYGLSVFTDAGNGAPRAAAVDALDKKEGESAKDYDARLAKWYKNPANAEAIAEKTRELVEKRLNSVYSGIWSIRGAGMGRRERILDTLVKSYAKELLPAEDWAIFEAMEEEVQSAKVASWYSSNQELFDEAVDKRLAELDAKRDEKKARLAQVTIAL